MKISQILDHRYDYNLEGLESIEINGKDYRTFPLFKPSIIFGMTFGKDCSYQSCNESLGRAMYDARDFFGKDNPKKIFTIAQREVYNSFMRLSGENDAYSFGVCKALEAKTRLNTDVSTLDAFQEGKDIIIKQGIDPSRILYVAHPAHMFRVLEMGKRIYANIGNLENAPFIEKEFSYNPNDDQKFVRDANSFATRELLARIHHKLKGLI